MPTPTHEMPLPETEAFVRLPGLFRGWEIAEVLDGEEYLIEGSGTADDGVELYSVYRRRDAEFQR